MNDRLVSMPPGRQVVVSHVDLPEATRQRLAEMGVRPGAGVHVVRRSTGGGRVIGVGGSRIALDSATAAAIEVHPDEGVAR